MIPRLDGADPRADRFHDPGTLVAEHRGERSEQMAGDDVQVTVANAGGDHADQDLPRLRFLHIEFTDLEPFACFEQYGSLGFHR